MKKNNIQKLLNKIEGKQLNSDKFHASTNNKKLDPSGKSDRKDIPQSWIKIHFKTYPRLDRISLDNIGIPTSKLSEIIRKRRSIRQFSSLPLSKNKLAYLLYLSSGLISLGSTSDESRRPYPSAGARYPLEIYPIVLNCKGIKNGLYHYNVKENSLELLLKEDLTDWVIKTTGGEKWIASTAVIFIISGVLDRTRIKYGERGYRYALIEAGHVGQNICLLATELNLGSCALGGYIDSEVEKLLDVGIQKESVLYLIAVGRI